MLYIVIGLFVLFVLMWLRYLSPIVVFYKHQFVDFPNLPRVQVGGHAVWSTSDDRIAPFTWKAVPTGLIPYVLWIYPKVTFDLVEDQNVILDGGLTKYHVGMDSATGEIIVYLFNNKPYPVDIQLHQYLGYIVFSRSDKNVAINI